MSERCEFTKGNKYPTCVKCGRKIPSGASLNTVAKCRKARRPRTAEELSAIIPICAACDHRTSDGLCGLKITSGCGSCRSIEAFSQFRKSGAACPDGRFEGTELVRINDGISDG